MCVCKYVHVHVCRHTCTVHVSVYVCVSQVAESNTEVSGKSQQLSALNAELVQEREGLEHEECQEG